ncbi:hypothetical protein QFZ75_006623 [Streptomyces sp. V3I8]|nr:hypothetical protein [Streptomyces sp. V3I8]
MVQGGSTCPAARSERGSGSARSTCRRHRRNPWYRCGQSKLANALFTVELDRRRADGIRGYAVHRVSSSVRPSTVRSAGRGRGPWACSTRSAGHRHRAREEDPAPGRRHDRIRGHHLTAGRRRRRLPQGQRHRIAGRRDDARDARDARQHPLRGRQPRLGPRVGTAAVGPQREVGGRGVRPRPVWGGPCRYRPTTTASSGAHRMPSVPCGGSAHKHMCRPDPLPGAGRNPRPGRGTGRSTTGRTPRRPAAWRCLRGTRRGSGGFPGRRARYGCGRRSGRWLPA